MKGAKRVCLFAATLCFAAVFGILFLLGAPDAKAADGSGVQAMEAVGGIEYTYYYYEGDSEEEGPYAVLKYADMHDRTECDVPESLGGYPVRYIVNCAFMNNSRVTRIALPGSVRKIDAFAFEGCTALTELDLANVQEIARVDILWRSVHSQPAPDEYYAGSSYLTLGAMPELKTITVSEQNAAFEVRDGVLMTKKAKDRAREIVCYPSGDPRTKYVIPDDCKGIRIGAFNSTSALKELKWNNWNSKENVVFVQPTTYYPNCDSIDTIDIGMTEKIERDTINKNEIYNIKIPYSLRLKEIKVDPENPDFTVKDGVLFSKDMKYIVRYPNGKEGSVYAVPDEVEVLSEGVFAGSCLEEVQLPETLSGVIPYAAFCKSKSFERIRIPDRVSGICSYAFKGCDSLKEIVIPPYTQNIDEELAGTDAVLKGEAGSFAEEWARENEKTFEAMEFERDANHIDCPYLGKTVTMEYGQQPKAIDISASTDLSYEVSGEAARVERLTAQQGKSPYATDKQIRLSVTPVKAGTIKVMVNAERNALYGSASGEITIKVTKASQRIKTDRSAYTGRCGKAVYLGADARTGLTYRNGDKKIAEVSGNGKILFKRPGKTTVTVIAAETAQYKGARKTVTIISKLARPHLEVITKKGQAKLSWNRVKGAEQIQLYVKYPGKKKYEKVMTRGAKLKSVMHKGLKRGKKYRYKVRVRAKTNGKYYYSAFSKTRVVRAR